jgi:hypothetical protein
VFTPTWIYNPIPLISFKHANVNLWGSDFKKPLFVGVSKIFSFKAYEPLVPLKCAIGTVKATKWRTLIEHFPATYDGIRCDFKSRSNGEA